MNIFVLGYLRSAYRSAGYLETFLDNGLTNIYINSFQFKRKSIIKSLVDIFMIFKSDIVFIPPLQHSNRLISLIFLLKKKYIVDFYISYYESNVFDYKKQNMYSNKAKKMKTFERKLINEAEKVVFLNNSEREYYLDVLEINKEKVNTQVIPLYIPEKEGFANLDFFYGRSKTLKLHWTGTYIPLHGLENILKAVQILSETKDINFHLYLWGDTEEKAKPYKAIANELGIENLVTFISKWNDLDAWHSHVVKNCDVSLGVFGESKKSKTVLPNKVIDAISFKTPVITQSSGGVREFNLDRCINVTDNSPNEIANEISNLYNAEKNLVLENIENAYTIYRNNFTYEKFQSNVKNLLNNDVMDKGEISISEKENSN